MKKLMVSVFAAFVASGACADYQRGFYAGVGAAKVSGDNRTAFEDAELLMVELIGGYRYNSALGLELRAAYGPEDDGDDESTYFQGIAAANPAITGIEREIGNYAAVYYRPELVNEEARLYGLLGYARLDTEVTTLGGVGANETLFTESESLSGLSYGVGVGFLMDNNLSLNFEYRKLMDDDSYRFKTVGLYLDYRF